MTSETSAIGSVLGYLQEPLVEPELDQRWTSDRELDRLAPLATSLHRWSQVYDQWRLHELAAARPQQPRFDRADLSAIDDLRGVHFGQLAATSRRLRNAGAALTRIGECTGVARSALGEAWRDDASQGAVRRFGQLQQGARDCAARCERLGLHLESGIIDAVARVITNAVDEILAHSRRWEHAAGRTPREVWEQRIAELDAQRSGGTSAEWRAELDALVIDYDAVIGLFRATLAAAEVTITRVYQVLHRELGSREGAPFATESGSVPGRAAGDELLSGADTPGGPDQEDGLAPASTALASAGSASADAPSAGSSSASGGGFSSGVAAVPGTGESGAGGSAAGDSGAGGSALLGELSEAPASGPGGARLASVSSDDPGYGAGAASGGAAGGTGFAPMAGALGAAGADDQQRTGRPWTVAAGADKEREASWERLRALLGEDAGERPEQGRAGR